MNKWGIDTGVLNFKNLNKQTIIEAKQTLQNLAILIDEYDEIQLEKNQNIEKVLNLRDQIADESSKFYEIIPHTQFLNTVVPPIQTTDQLAKH